MAGKRKTPTRDTSSYGDQPVDRAGFGSARNHGRAGERALQQWADGRSSPNHRSVVQALRPAAKPKKKK